MTKLGIQTIIFGKRTGEDLPGVLKDIKAAGYDGLEFGMSARTPEEVRGLFSAAGLVLLRLPHRLPDVPQPGGGQAAGGASDEGRSATT
jgi:sugar phosphate isomerase/epimerase